MFYSYYYRQGKLYTIRRKISSFGQRESEKLVDAYISYREILFACPEHHYPDCLIVNFFYGGLDSQSTHELVHASNGSFMGTEISQAWNLIELDIMLRGGTCVLRKRRRLILFMIALSLSL